MGRILVVGAGVVGLSCAVRLLEAGHRVDVVARDLPLETTSAVAAALWYPYLASHDRVAHWASSSHQAFEVLAGDDATGVRMAWGTEVTSGSSPVRSVAPVIEMPQYLPWLAHRVQELGGSLTRLNLSSLPRVDHPVVNCSAIGSRLLAADPTLAPVRGQVLCVEQVGLEEWWLDAAGPTYVVPRSADIVVGGTEERGDWSRTVSQQSARDILDRAVALVPQLAGARVLRQKVGLRPWRPAVRVERVGEVVHCYGHGGSGVTLSWGCADEVVGLLGG